jgi:hypothetical protein
MTSTTQHNQSAQVKAATQLAIAIAEAIRSAGEIPAGHIYAVVMEKVGSLDNFEVIIRGLVRTGLVKRDPSHLLRWIGPAKGEHNG